MTADKVFMDPKKAIGYCKKENEYEKTHGNFQTYYEPREYKLNTLYL